MITIHMFTASTRDVLAHAQKHMNECQALLKEIETEGTSLEARLQDIKSLKLHLDIISSDAQRALLIMGD
jgi:hypothetical protein